MTITRTPSRCVSCSAQLGQAHARGCAFNGENMNENTGKNIAAEQHLKTVESQQQCIAGLQRTIDARDTEIAHIKEALRLTQVSVGGLHFEAARKDVLATAAQAVVDAIRVDQDCVRGSHIDALEAALADPGEGLAMPAGRKPIGYITTGDVEHTSDGAEIGDWDIDWDHKVIDSMDEFAVPETTYAVYLEPVAATATKQAKPELASEVLTPLSQLVRLDLTDMHTKLVERMDYWMCRALNAAQPVPQPSGERDGFDFHAHLARQAAWSEKTFGPGARTAGVCDHIRKELLKVEADPLDLKEWVDVVILALDGAWRCGGSPDEIISGIVAKQTKNEGRNWPDWRTADPNKAIEHDRTDERAATTSKPNTEGN